MHKSKLGGFIIDCQSDDLDRAADFWGAALGDDIEAEVHRLEELGAKRIQAVQSWWVMEAPTGQRFRVVRATSTEFAERATQWPETRGRPPASVANPGWSGLLSQIGDILDIVHQLPNITP